MYSLESTIVVPLIMIITAMCVAMTLYTLNVVRRQTEYYEQTEATEDNVLSNAEVLRITEVGYETIMDLIKS